MVRISTCEELRAETIGLGLNGADEEGRTVLAWLWDELRHVPNGRASQEVIDAARNGLALFRAFMESFSDCFLEEGCPGPHWVAQALRAQIGFAPAAVVEAVLDRIAGRRFHLLDSFRRRYQPELFGPLLLQRSRLRGYFIRVARLESRHVPLDRLLGTVSLVPECLPDAADPFAADEGESFEERARMLAEFWSQERFTPQMRLEGLASLALGHLTGDSVLARRCQEFLAARLPAWEQRHEQLAAQAGQLLARLDREQARLRSAQCWAYRDATEQELARLRGRLESVRRKLWRHQNALFPRPRQVARLLAGRVDRPQARLRFDRLRCEAALLEQRARDASGLGESELALAGELAALLADRPANPRRHGLSEEERAQRRQDQAAWQRRGVEILGRVRRRLAGAYPAQTKEQGRSLTWLLDVVGLFECVLLDHVGVVGGLRRPTWQLECLLRAE